MGKTRYHPVRRLGGYVVHRYHIVDVVVNRSIHTPDFTLGELLIDGRLIFFTVERPWLDNANNISCIPVGRYQLIVNNSQRFRRRLPLLLNVPDRDGIRIHEANWASELQGCIAIGTTRIKGGVGNSRLAMQHFLPRLDAALERGKVWIEVRDAA